MALIIPYTFVAGTKAKAAEVNADFQAVATEVNAQGNSLTTAQANITNLQNNKADINGNSSNRFSVATPINSYDAVNKLYLTDLTKYLLVGLQLRKDDDDYIGCTKGATYDKTYSKILKFDADVNKQNTNQSANSTYYVYIEGSADGTSTDLLISLSSDNPALDSGFTLYQYLGYYTTDDDGNIETVYSVAPASGLEVQKNFGLTVGFPDFTAPVSKAWNEEHTADKAGWIYANAYTGETFWRIDVDSQVFEFGINYDATGRTGIMLPIREGTKYKASGGNLATPILTYYPFVKSIEE